MVGRSKKGFITTSTQNELYNRLKKFMKTLTSFSKCFGSESEESVFYARKHSDSSNCGFTQ